ncbi:MAG: MarC family protein [Chlamydiae bacterium]|nr:MarC family protein [Chlamydiota bacterium]
MLVDIKSFISLAISFFFVLNAIGQMPVYLAILAPFDHARQKKIIFRELLIALGVLLAFNFYGENILNALRITKSTIGIAGGLLLGIIAINLIFPKNEINNNHYGEKEPFIIPLAVPGLAGPGAITAAMIFSTQYGKFLSAGAIVSAWIPSLILLLASSYVKKFLGEKGMQAVEKFGGMLLWLIGIEMFASGVIELIKTNFPIR